MGASTSTDPTDPAGFQLTYFKVNDIRVKNVFDELERNTGEAIRGDREMSTCEMLDVIREADREEDEARRDRRDLLRDDLRALLALPQLPDDDTLPGPKPLPAYCRWMESGAGRSSFRRRRAPRVPHRGGPVQGTQGRKPAQGKSPGPGRGPDPGAAVRPGDRRPGRPAPQRLHGPAAFQLVADRDRDRPGAGRRAARRPLRGRGPQEVGDQHRPASPSSSSGS